jgi:hypothetical protein
LYENPADIAPLLLHSVYLDRRGPTVTLRLSTPALPERPPAEWLESGCDHVGFQLQFLDVADLSLTGPDLPAPVALSCTEQDSDRVRVEVRGASVDLGFSSHRSVTIGRISAWNSAAAGEPPLHHYLSPLDRRLYSSPPETWKKNYYGRI